VGAFPFLIRTLLVHACHNLAPLSKLGVIMLTMMYTSSDRNHLFACTCAISAGACRLRTQHMMFYANAAGVGLLDCGLCSSRHNVAGVCHLGCSAFPIPPTTYDVHMLSIVCAGRNCKVAPLRVLQQSSVQGMQSLMLQHASEPVNELLAHATTQAQHKKHPDCQLSQQPQSRSPRFSFSSCTHCRSPPTPAHAHWKRLALVLGVNALEHGGILQHVGHNHEPDAAAGGA
jgi:hypothetical protein